MWLHILNTSPPSSNSSGYNLFSVSPSIDDGNVVTTCYYALNRLHDRRPAHHIQTSEFVAHDSGRERKNYLHPAQDTMMLDFLVNSLIR